MIPRSLIKNGWSVWHIVMSVALVGLAIMTTLDAWKDIWGIATVDEESSHIFLVPFVAAWLIYVRRGRFRHCRPRGTAVGHGIMLLGWLLYSWGDGHYVLSVWHAGAVLLAVGAVFAVLGSDVLFSFLPALVILAFLVPVPGRVRQAIAIPLEGVTAQVTQQACEMMGMTLERSGNTLTINNQPVEIAEACNGLRMVFALTLVSFAFALGTPLRWYVRVIVVLASPVSAIFCNVVRLVPTVWLYGYAPKWMADRFHDLSGWVMLPLAFLLLMGIVKVLRWALIPVNTFTLAYD